MNEYWGIFLRKELRDIKGNPQVLPGFLLLPAIAVLLPLGMLAFAPLDPAAGNMDPDLVRLLEMAGRDPALAGYPPAERMVRLGIREFGAFFLLIPVLLSSMSAALSVAGEKQQRTLEPILATPIDDRTFLLAKLAAAVGPALIVTWVSAALFGVGAALVTLVRLGTPTPPSAPFLLGMAGLAPLGGIIAALMGMRVSIKAADVQAAIQSAGLWVVPAGLILIGLFGRPALRSVPLALAAILLFGGLAAWSFQRTLRRFEREEILTRWT